MLEPQGSVLTPREREVLALVARGLTNQEIAEDIYISTSAVKILLHQACVKLGARNRAQAVIMALRRGELAPRDIYSLGELAELLASLGTEEMETLAQLLNQKLASKKIQIPKYR